MIPSRPLPRLLLLLALPLLAACQGSDPSQVIPITEARTREAGTQVTVEGYVTVAPGTFVSAVGNEGFALQDDTGGLYVKLAPKLDFGLGTHVRVRGTLREEAQQRILESEPASIEKREGTRQITPQDKSTGGINESTEGLLVRVTGLVTQTLEDDLPYGYKLYFNDGSGPVQIFVHASAGFDAERLRALGVGKRIEVTGFSTQYETTYELAPRQSSDLVVP